MEYPVFMARVMCLTIKLLWGEEDIVGDVFGFELVATDGAVGRAQVSWFPRVGRGSRRWRKRTWGALGTVVVLTASGEGKLFNDRSRSRAWTSFLVSARTGMR
jgi:hypothetical protein